MLQFNSIQFTQKEVLEIFWLLIVLISVSMKKTTITYI